jgi:ribosomal protein L37AE/L43A
MTEKNSDDAVSQKTGSTYGMFECTYCGRSNNDVKALRYGRESTLVCPSCWRRLKRRINRNSPVSSYLSADVSETRD